MFLNVKIIENEFVDIIDNYIEFLAKYGEIQNEGNYIVA